MFCVCTLWLVARALNAFAVWGRQEEEAVTSALEAFKLQGVDLSRIIKARSGGNTDKCAPLYTSRWRCAWALATPHVNLRLHLCHCFLKCDSKEIFTAA